MKGTQMSKTLYGLVFVQTHDACPESYDVFDNGTQIATATFQWGKLVCTKSGREVYTRKAPNGWEGRFRTDEERTQWLEDAARHIKAA